MKTKLTLIYFIILGNLTLQAQQKGVDNIALKSIDGIVNETLRLISVEKGKPRDLVAFKNLFTPNARFSVLNNENSNHQDFESVDLEEFMELLKDPYYEQGFEEREIGKAIHQYNGIANVFQSFYAKDSEGVEGRGVNSYQLVYYQERWWITNLIWTNETENHKIPEKYLRN